MSDAKDIYCRVPSRIVELYGDKFPFEIFIKLKSGKAIRLSNKDDNIKDTFEKYKAKGVEDIFVVKDAFKSFITAIRSKTSNKLFNPNTLEKEQVDLLSDSHKLVGEAFRQIGTTPETVALAKDVSTASLKIMDKTPNIFAFFESFKERCGHELAHIMLTSYLMSMMLDTFDWASTGIKEKASLGCMLCDVLLDENEIKNVRENKKTPGLLCEKEFHHPDLTAQKLTEQAGIIPKEAIEIVKFHHESPDGLGFPFQTAAKNITLLPAIYIVAECFAEMMFSNYFDFSKRDMMVEELNKKFNTGNFRNAFFALSKGLEL